MKEKPHELGEHEAVIVAVIIVGAGVMLFGLVILWILQKVGVIH